MRLKDKQLSAYQSASGKSPDPSSPREKNFTKGSTPKESGKPRASASKGSASLPSFLKTGSGEISYRKAAKFLLLLGKDEAAKVLKHLEPDEVEKLSREIAGIQKITDAEAEYILAEFGFLTKESRDSGGVETAKAMLVKAFGSEKGEDLLARAVPESQPKPFAFLADLDVQQILLLLKDESIAVISVVVSRLSPAIAGKLLSRMPPAEQREIVVRLARMKALSPEVLGRMETAMEEKLRRIGRIVTEELDGTSAIASILRYMSPSDEAYLLGEIEDVDPKLGQKVREGLFTLDDILEVPARELQESLRGFDDRTLALILKGKEGEFRDRLLANVSQTRRELVMDEYEILGSVRKSDCDQATREFLSYFKRLYEEGKILLKSRHDDYV